MRPIMGDKTNTRDSVAHSELESSGAAPASGHEPGSARRAVSGGAVRVALQLIRVGPFFMLLVLCAVMASLTPLFLTGRNLTNLGYQSTATVCLALGQLVVILTRGIDISVGSIVGLVVVAGSILYADHLPVGLIILAMLALGAGAGAANGLLLVKGRLTHPFIVTLATLGIIEGIAFLWSGGVVLSGQPPLFYTLGEGKIRPVPWATILAIALAGLTWIVTKRMQWGRWIYAIGGNPEGAKRVGIPVGAVLVSVYVFSGVMAAFAGVVTAGQIGVGDANAGALFELNAIAAVMIGGASFLGGRGSVSNAVVGAITVTVITNGLELQNISGNWQEIAIGGIILVAVEVNVLRDYLEGRFRLMQAAAADHGGASS